MGKNGRNITAPIILNMFPKLELNHIIRYFIVFPNVFLHSITHSRSSLSHFFTKMISAASLATSTALLTEIHTSELFKDGASLIPSQRYPTTNHFFLRTDIILSFWLGDNLAKIFASMALTASSSSPKTFRSRYSHDTMPSMGISRSSHIFLVTNGLSHVSIFIEIPCSCMAINVCFTSRLGGS